MTHSRIHTHTHKIPSHDVYNFFFIVFRKKYTMVAVDDTIDNTDKQEEEKEEEYEDPLARFGEAFLDSFEDGIRPTKIVSKTLPSTRVIKKKKKKNKTTLLASSTSTNDDDSGRTPSNSSSSGKKERKRRKAEASAVEDELDIFNALLPDKTQRVATSTTSTSASSMPGAAPKTPGAEKELNRARNGSDSDKKNGDDMTEKRENKEKELSQFMQHKKEFNNAIQEINKFVKPRLNKKQKKFYDEQKILALGGSLKKQQKCPYRIRKQEDANREIKRRKRIETDRILGISTSFAGKHHMRRHEAMTKKKKEEKATKERRQGHINLGLNVGRADKGMLNVKKSFVGKYK